MSSDGRTARVLVEPVSALNLSKRFCAISFFDLPKIATGMPAVRLTIGLTTGAVRSMAAGEKAVTAASEQRIAKRRAMDRRYK